MLKYLEKISLSQHVLSSNMWFSSLLGSGFLTFIKMEEFKELSFMWVIS